jgi:hypothetical protein
MCQVYGGTVMKLHMKTLCRRAALVLALGGTLAATTSPASAWWCRWGCGPGPVAAGLIGGLAVGTLVGAAAHPYYYGPPPAYYYGPPPYGPPPYGPPGSVARCAPGYHLDPQGGACWPN